MRVFLFYAERQDKELKVKRMIQELLKFDSDLEVKLHHIYGNKALFVFECMADETAVVLKDKSDVDLGYEIAYRFEHASKHQTDELDFFLDLLERGITLEDIRETVPDKYEYSKNFLEEHGLL